MGAFFYNRQQAGQLLAQALISYKKEDVIILALPRGGVVLAVEIAKILKAPLDCTFSHKIGHPLYAEYAIAALSEGGEMVGNQEELQKVDAGWLEQEKKKNRLLMQQRRKLYLQGREKQDLTGKIAIIVDDGVATGLTMFAAILEVKKSHPKKVIVAVPIAPKETADKIRKQVDDLVALRVDSAFLGAVGAYYEEFDQVTDDEVIKILQNSRASKQ